MIQMLFFVRFRGQFRRTKPELISSLEDTVAAAALAAGGETETGRKILSASFDEGRIGFWLDMVIFLEKIKTALERAAPELYGYAFALGRDIPESSFQKLCLSLSGSGSGLRSRIRPHAGGQASPAEGKDSESTGIWCSREVREALEFYMVFDTRVRPDVISDGYGEFREFKSFENNPEFPHREKIKRNLALGNDKNTVLLAPEQIGIRDSVYHYCRDLLGDTPPLIVRFGAGGRGLICFADAYTPTMRSFLSGANSGEKLMELDTIHAMLFSERLREEWSPYAMEQSRRFIYCLLKAYIAAVKTQKAPAGILVLEDISLAGAAVAGIFKEVYSSLNDRLLVLAVNSSSWENLKDWDLIFPRILRFNPDDFSAAERDILPRDFLKEIPQELCELSYTIYLLGLYFPDYLFPLLFDEEGLNKDVYFRSVGILSALGFLSPNDPRPRFQGFAAKAEKALAGRKEKVRSAVRNRILGWAFKGKLRPCFNLIRILSELGEGAEGVLVLRSLKADVLNGTWEAIEEALKNGNFAALVGKGNVPVLTYIYKTLKVLVWGTASEIKQVFLEPVPSLTLKDGRPCYGGFRAQVQTNLAAFHIGSRNIEAASEAVRKAMLINQELCGDAVPAFRFFSLMNLSRQRIDDAMEYISFALEQAGKAEQSEEFMLTCYYASSIYFLYGNLSKAEQFALRAEETARRLGQSEWDARSRFLRARLYFETGRYEDALEIFESLGAAGQPALVNTVGAWRLRTKNFMGRFSPSESFPEGNPDGGIFKIEKAYFAAEYEKAVALADNFLSTSGEMPNDDFLFTEQADWRSGFSQCEYLFRPEKVPGTRLVWVYRAMAQCALHPSQEAKEEILGSMQRFMREEVLSDTDPNDSFYFYAWYSMFRNTGAAQVDMNTVVSMAFKRLQRRAGRIDDGKIKQAFFKSKWNSALYLAAKEHKLI